MNFLNRFQVESDSAANNLLQQMDEASDKAVKAHKILARSAAKKGVKSTEAPTGTTTRAAAKLKPTDPALAKFNLKNLSLAKSEDDLKYQLQEMVALVVQQYEKAGLSMHQQSSMTAFAMKEFQRAGIFNTCDHMAYHLEGNTVSHELD